MALTFADTYNMIAYRTKSDASEGFDQIIDFLNASSIKYALTVNPNVYVLCIKQFWTSVSVKKVNDVTRLQALVDKKKVIITKATIRDALRLNDAESIDCLPNEEIFTELSRMGAQVGDLSLHTTKYSSPALTQKVFANMRRVGKGFLGVDTPLFKGMLVAQQVDKGAANVNVDDVPATGVADEGAADVNADVVLTALKQRMKKLERRNKLKVSKLRRLKRVGTAQRVDTSDDTVMDDVSKQGRIIADMIPTRQETEVPQPSSPTHTHVVDEAASTGVDVRHGGAATTVSSLDAGEGSGNIDKTPSMPHDSPLPRVNTLGSVRAI
nr:xylulose kinase-1 [Tanacetum cinerariifolium]